MTKRGSNGIITVRVPIAVRRRGGRKLVLAPEGADWAPPVPRVNNTMVKALARGFRWRKLLEEGHYDTIAELARNEKISPGYVGRLLKLTLLAPVHVENIVDGRQPCHWDIAFLWVQGAALVWRN